MIFAQEWEFLYHNYDIFISKLPQLTQQTVVHLAPSGSHQTPILEMWAPHSLATQLIIPGPAASAACVGGIHGNTHQLSYVATIINTRRGGPPFQRQCVNSSGCQGQRIYCENTQITHGTVVLLYTKDHNSTVSKETKEL